MFPNEPYVSGHPFFLNFCLLPHYGIYNATYIESRKPVHLFSLKRYCFANPRGAENKDPIGSQFKNLFHEIRIERDHNGTGRSIGHIESRKHVLQFYQIAKTTFHIFFNGICWCELVA
jgi:hypothetical protein